MASINRYFFRVNKNYYVLAENSREDVKMSVALNYQLSVFGKFTIAPLPDVITALMNKINAETQETFLPNIINSQQIEIPSNRIITTANLGFVTQNQQYSISFHLRLIISRAKDLPLYLKRQFLIILRNQKQRHERKLSHSTQTKYVY